MRFSKATSELRLAPAQAQADSPAEAARQMLVLCGLMQLVWIWQRRSELGDSDSAIAKDFDL